MRWLIDKMKWQLAVVLLFVIQVKINAQEPNVFPKKGSVGIGTSYPKGSLEVKGTSFLEQLVLGESNKPTNALFQLTIPVGFTDSTAFLIASSTRRLFQVSENGIVRAREIIVDQADNWPDYVFSDNYRLRTLGELKTYIATHHHLPDIPSALNVEQDGIQLGEMNRLLLQKIEELTLYILQQEERIRQLEANQQK